MAGWSPANPGDFPTVLRWPLADPKLEHDTDAWQLIFMFKRHHHMWPIHHTWTNASCVDALLRANVFGSSDGCLPMSSDLGVRWLIANIFGSSDGHLPMSLDLATMRRVP